MTKEESTRYSEALALAADMHKKQQRKDGTPYILHPIRVAMSIARDGYDVRYQIVGLFHDLLEDTEATEEQLREFCDDEMLEAVRLVTKIPGRPEAEYIDNILANPMAKVVKNADRIDNLTDLQESTNQQFRENYLRETKEYFLGRFSKELDELYRMNTRKIPDIDAHAVVEYINGVDPGNEFDRKINEREFNKLEELADLLRNTEPASWGKYNKK